MSVMSVHPRQVFFIMCEVREKPYTILIWAGPTALTLLTQAAANSRKGISMQSYIDKLKAEADAERTRFENSKVSKTDPRMVCEKPLTQQIEELMAFLPPSEKQRRWTMAEFVANLSGHYKA